MLGLSLAYELSHAGLDVTIIEKNSDWGGLASGIKLGENYIEKYYHHWFRSDDSIQDLIKELGLSHKLQFLESSMGIYLNGKTYNFSGTMNLLSFRPMNVFNRLRTGLVSFYLQHSKYSKKLEKVSALEWCNKKFGKKATKLIWEPLLKGKFGKYADKISMSWMWARIHDRASSRSNPLSKEYLGYMDGGFQLLINTLVKKLEEFGVKLLNNAEIKGYKYTGNKHELNIDGKTHEFDIVVSTIPGPIFTKIFPTSDKLKKQIDKVKYLGATCMLLEMDQSLTPYYWLNINDPEAPFLAIVEHTNFVDKEKYNGNVLVYIAKYIDPQEELFNKTEEELVDLYAKYLVKINPDFNKNWILKTRLYKSPYAQHVVMKNYEVPDYETGTDGLYYANFTQIYPHDRGTNYAVAQSKDLAKLIREKHGD